MQWDETWVLGSVFFFFERELGLGKLGWPVMHDGTYCLVGQWQHEGLSLRRTGRRNGPRIEGEGDPVETERTFNPARGGEHETRGP
jgi:hypothetical protein